MEVGGEDVGRITFELRADVAPKTAENFVSGHSLVFHITLARPRADSHTIVVARPLHW